MALICSHFRITLEQPYLKWAIDSRGGEWYLEKHESLKILAGSRNLGNVFDESRSLVFSWFFFFFPFFESRNFSPKSLGLGFLTRISASRRVSDFTIRHPWQCLTTRFDLSLKKLRKNNGWWKLALFCVTIPGNKKVVFGKYWLIKSSGGGGGVCCWRVLHKGRGEIW